MVRIFPLQYSIKTRFLQDCFAFYRKVKQFFVEDDAHSGFPGAENGYDLVTNAKINDNHLHKNAIRYYNKDGFILGTGACRVPVPAENAPCAPYRSARVYPRTRVRGYTRAERGKSNIRKGVMELGTHRKSFRISHHHVRYAGRSSRKAAPQAQEPARHHAQGGKAGVHFRRMVFR